MILLLFFPFSHLNIYLANSTSRPSSSFVRFILSLTNHSTSYTRSRVRRDTREKRANIRKKKKREREKERIIIVQSSRRRIRIHIHIHTYIQTRVYHFSKLLDPVHVRDYSHWKMPADRFAPYPLPPHISHSEYRKVK
jgi:hypothetical protein